MADDLRMALQDVLRKAQLEGNVDFLRVRLTFFPCIMRDCW